ncbi:branched-chain amino acid ABC transporter permease [Paroceanicella profunda]|uniref:Branched-chain amino acid ABC transporter permease n=1 Tax=Paroceanicella profunda TaxID=2579971 RepID=A0A5B8FI53_9RHOB|nr:branched-chain amino acid ABC transporter permease [Paroceanicella profunda]QDL93321.1 branched-chain amino acid ABC transporter permease [Paroceanicella profunda]
MTNLLQALLDGVLNGGVYGVIAIGLTLVFGILGIVNFAHAQFVMIGMYVAWFAWHTLRLDPIAGAFLSLLVGGAIGAALEYLFVRHVVKASVVAQIFLTVGLIAVLENVALIFLGSDYRSVQTAYQTQALHLGPILVSVPYLLAFAAAVIMAVSLRFLLTSTWTGRAIRATAQDEQAAISFGINTRKIYALAFGLGTGLTAFGGGIILPYATVNPTVGAHYVVLMFTVAVLGGLGSTTGALAGGVLVGVIQSISTLILPVQMKDLALFVVFIAILAVRPQGLLGGVSR